MNIVFKMKMNFIAYENIFLKILGIGIRIIILVKI